MKKCLLLLGFCYSLLPVIQLAAQDSLSFQSPSISGGIPWTDKPFFNQQENFQFAIVSDRTGGHREGIFGKAVEKLNLLMPEFVMSVGDLIEGSMYPDTISKQWAEFDSILSPLDMRFFFVPGNHDIANDRMRQEWRRRHGQTYYHFLYKNVLFLAFDSTDGDDDATFSEAQVKYFKGVIADNPDVHWTLIFMHHPVWMYNNDNPFDQIESALGDGPYTVFAGHTHNYLYSKQNNQNYYVLATTGGGSRLRGPRLGEFDHVTWITLTPEGPRMLNLKLDAMLSHDISPIEEREKRKALLAAAKFNSLLTQNPSQSEGKIHFLMGNTSQDTLFFQGRLYHNHHLNFDTSRFSFAIPPSQSFQQQLSWTFGGKMPLELIDPVEIDFTLGYKPEIAEPPFQIEGTYTLTQPIRSDQLHFTEPALFLTETDISIGTPLNGLEVRYTTDGSLPNASSPIYQGPIQLSKSTLLRAALFDPETGYGSEYREKNYQKVEAFAPLDVQKSDPGLKYRYFEGNFLMLPEFDTLNPVKEGIAHDFEVANIAPGRIDHYALEYTGYIEVYEEGLYTFFTHSDDGSKVYIHDQLVVNNDGSHSARTQKGYVALKAGLHPIKIEYFEDFLGQELSLMLKSPSDTQRKPVVFTQLFP